MAFRFRLRPKTMLVGLILCGLMTRLSFWQWDRYEQKKVYIAHMQQRLSQPVLELSDIIVKQTPSWDELPYRKVHVRGSFDFEHEMALRNRRYQEVAGVYALTPLKIELPETAQAPRYVLVSRGFVPLSKSDRNGRREFQKDSTIDFIGLVKESTSQRFLAPSDPPAGLTLPWVDAWLRVDIPRIGTQLTYPLLPVWLEVMETQDQKGIEEQILNSKSGREELFFLPGKESQLSQIQSEPNLPYPMPVFDTVIPPGRHFGYIFEWAVMAFFTLLTTILLQCRAPRKAPQ